MKNKVTALLMSIILLISVFGFGVSSFAEDLDTPIDNEIIEEYQVIFDHTSGINIVGVTAKCNASLGAQYSTTLTITMELQDAFLFNIPYRKNWLLDGVSFEVFENTADLDVDDDLVIKGEVDAEIEPIFKEENE